MCYSFFVKLILSYCDVFVNFANHDIRQAVYGKIQNIFLTDFFMKFPDNLHYTNEHMWTQELADGLWVAGITDYAQDLLGDVVFVDPPKVGSPIKAATPCGLVESVKTGSDLHAPLDGEVVEINQEVLDAPESLNDKPYKHWIFKFKATDKTQADTLLSATAYQDLTAN